MDQIETTYVLALHYAISSNNVIKRSAGELFNFSHFGYLDIKTCQFLHKIPSFHLISWGGNSVEMHSFHFNI